MSIAIDPKAYRATANTVAPLINISEMVDTFLDRCEDAIRGIYKSGERPSYGSSYLDRLKEAIAVNVIELDDFTPHLAYMLRSMLKAYRSVGDYGDGDDYTLPELALEIAIRVCEDSLIEERARTPNDIRARALFLQAMTWEEEHEMMGNWVRRGELVEAVVRDAMCGVGE